MYFVLAFFLFSFSTVTIVEPSITEHVNGKQRETQLEHSLQRSPLIGEWANVLRAVANEKSSSAPKCVDIPKKFSLCYGIQYASMRLPNLLEHETLEEAIQQSVAWNSLLKLHCHPDTKLFLCSLFAPICLPNMDKHIQPCQSLCLAVQQGCESRMAQYGFPWPEMLRCRFPEDNDMCIKAVSEHSNNGKEVVCKGCAQVPTFENLMDNYCRSKTVLKARLKFANSTHITVVKTRSFKEDATTYRNGTIIPKELILPLWRPTEPKCKCLELFMLSKSKESKLKGNFLIMITYEKLKGKKTEGLLSREPVIQLILPWRPHDKVFKRAIHKFRKVNCHTLGREIRESVFGRKKNQKKINH